MYLESYHKMLVRRCNEELPINGIIACFLRTHRQPREKKGTESARTWEACHASQDHPRKWKSSSLLLVLVLKLPVPWSIACNGMIHLCGRHDGSVLISPWGTWNYIVLPLVFLSHWHELIKMLLSLILQ